MIKRFLPVFLMVAGVCAGPSFSLRAQQAAPVDPKAVLATLKDLRARQAGIITKEKSGVLAAITAALADPGKAWVQAEDSQEPHTPGVNEGTRTMEVRKRQTEQLHNKEFVNGLRLQLSYLSLTWQHGMGVKTKDQIAALIDYANQVNSDYDGLATLDMFKKSLGESVFTTYFQVGPYISGLQDWSDHPFDTESIYQKTILPQMRKDKDPRLMDYWDNHLQSEAARASASGNGLVVTKFNHVRRPSLLWSRAEDELAMGNANQAVADMLAIIKANPDHPDFEKWAAELEGIVSAKTEPAGDAAGGPASSPVPVAPTTATVPVAR